MKHCAAFIAALWLGGVGAGAQSWTNFTAADNGIAVDMPCEVRFQRTDTPQKDGTPASVDLFGTCNAADETYLLGWSDYEEGYRFDYDGELLANRDNMLKPLNSNLLTSGWITYSGIRSLEFTATIQGGVKLVTSRVFIVGRRPYMVAVVTPLNANRSENIRRFLSSVRLSPR